MILFNRKSELIFSNGIELKSDDGVRLDFSFKTTNKENIPTATITIKNITNEIIGLIDSKLDCIFNIGFGDTFGLLVEGDIENLEFKQREVKFDIVSNSKNFTKNYSKFYAKGARATFIINDIAKNTNLSINGLEHLTDKEFKKGLTVRGLAINSIVKICSKFDLNVSCRGNTLVIYDKAKIGEIMVVLEYSSGLLNVLKNDDEKYDLTAFSLPIPSLTQGDIIQLNSDNHDGVYKIIDFEIEGNENWTAKYFLKKVGE